MGEDNCHWCGLEIENKNESVERREFGKDGKVCYYFCGDECEIFYIAKKMNNQVFLERLNTSVEKALAMSKTNTGMIHE